MTTFDTATNERLRLRLEQSPGPDSQAEPFLEAAGRALAEAQANLDHPKLKQECRMTKQAVRELVAAFSKEAWTAPRLDGEAPIDELHREFSGWRGTRDRTEKIPWLVLAADALDFIATAMGDRDILVLETKS